MSPQDIITDTDLLRTAFGLYGRFPVFVLGDHAPGVNNEQYYTNDITGAKVWDRITLKNNDSDNLNYTNRAGEFIAQPSYTFPDSVLIEASRAKDIIRTKVAGADGKVKEEISKDDWQITLRGYIINYTNDDYPKLEVNRLIGAFNRPLECGVVSKFLNNVLKVYNLVLGEISFKATPGFPNIQAFEIPAESDEPIIFKLSKK